MEFERVEKQILFLNVRETLQESQATTFNLEHIQDLHSRLCQHLEQRHDVLKPGELKVPTRDVSLIGKEARVRAGSLMGEEDKRVIAENVAYIIGRIETQQPFHSLNSQVAKIYAHSLAQTAGHVIDWQSVNGQSFDTAVESAKARNLEPLTELIESNLQLMTTANKTIITTDNSGRGIQTGALVNNLDRGFQLRTEEFQVARGQDAGQSIKGSKPSM